MTSPAQARAFTDAARRDVDELRTRVEDLHNRLIAAETATATDWARSAAATQAAARAETAEQRTDRLIARLGEPDTPPPAH